MKIGLVCLASNSVGGGHLIRCLALAEQGHSRGHDVVLVGAWEAHPAAQSLPEWLEVVEVGDLASAASFLKRATVDVCHADLYEPFDFPSHALSSAMRDGAFGTSPSSLVFDPTIAPTVRDMRPAESSGPDYAPLRRSVVDRRGAWRAPTGDGHSVLVALGSTDPTGLSPKVLRAVASLPGVRVTVVGRSVGAEEHGHLNVTRLPFVEDFAALALRHDLVVTAAGSTTLELACLGVPMAVLCVSDNQREGYARLVERDLVLGLGDATTGWSPDRVAADVEYRLEEEEVRVAAADRAAALVDGLGASRIVQAWERSIAGSPLTARVAVRPVTREDEQRLLEWRNDPVTRSVSIAAHEIDTNEHRTWFLASLASSSRVMFIAERHGMPVGTTRFDRSRDGVWSVSIMLGPENRGRGLGTAVLEASEQALRARMPGDLHFLATVHTSNEASLRLFGSAGYVRRGVPNDDGFVHLVKSAGP